VVVRKQQRWNDESSLMLCLLLVRSNNTGMRVCWSTVRGGWRRRVFFASPLFGSWSFSLSKKDRTGTQNLLGIQQPVDESWRAIGIYFHANNRVPSVRATQALDGHATLFSSNSTPVRVIASVAPFSLWVSSCWNYIKNQQATQHAPPTAHLPHTKRCTTPLHIYQCDTLSTDTFPAREARS